MTLGDAAAAGRAAAPTSRVGEGQPLGNRLDFGGPSFGFFCATEELHPPHAGPDRRRDRPTSTAAAASCSPCRRASSTSAARRRPTTSAPRQALNALGGDDLPRLARPRRASSSSASCWSGAPPTRASGSAAVDGVELLHDAPVVREFAVRLDAPVERGARPLRRARHRRRLPARRATTPSTRTACWSRSPSGARSEQIDGSPTRSAPRSPPARRLDGADGGAEAATAGAAATETPMQRERADDDLREVEARPPRRAAARRRRAGARRSRS